MLYFPRATIEGVSVAKSVGLASCPLIRNTPEPSDVGVKCIVRNSDGMGCSGGMAGGVRRIGNNIVPQ